MRRAHRRGACSRWMMGPALALAMGFLGAVTAGTADAEGVMYVNRLATGDGSGRSWADGKTTIQEGITSASEATTISQVWVAAGTYSESIAMASGVWVFGGFQGTESALDQRDPAARSTIIDAAPPAGSGPRRAVIFDEIEDAILDGFTITGGRADASAVPYGPVGGGIYFRNTGVLVGLADCVITSNVATHGGGVYVTNAFPVLDRCEIHDNRAEGGNGGGLWLGNGSALIVDTVIADNVATSVNASSGHGGGVYDIQGDNQFEQVTITGNHADGDGGGLYGRQTVSAMLWSQITGNTSNRRGGGVAADSADPVFEHTVIADNTSRDSGGGVYCANGAPLINSGAILRNRSAVGGGVMAYNSAVPDIINCAIAFNQAEQYGGGLTLSLHSNALVVNSVVHGNRSLTHQGGGAYCVGDSDATFLNVIFSANQGVAVYKGDAVSDPFLQHCLFFDNVGGHVHDPKASPPVYDDVNQINLWAPRSEGNVRGDPLFVDPEAGDFRIQDGSSALKRGRARGAPPTDFEGDLRPGIDGFVDIGLDEDAASSPPLDLTPPVSVIVNLPEFSTQAVTEIRYRASDAESGVDFVRLFYRMEGQTQWQPFVGAHRTGVIAFNTMLTGGDGTYELRTQATDRAGNEEPLGAEPYGTIMIFGTADFTGNIVHVSVGGQGIGQSWAQPAGSIGQAIRIARNFGMNVIRVSQGEYREPVLLGTGLRLYGGFRGAGAGAGNPDDRNIAAFETIIHGDGAPHAVVMRNVNNTRLDGFTITGGQAQGDGANGDGGGVYCFNSGSTNVIAACRITGNTARRYGGGVHLDFMSAPILFNCVIADNHSDGQGGGLSSVMFSSPFISACDILDNTAEYGGGVFVEEGEPTLVNTIISGNRAEVYGGGVYSHFYGDPLLLHCALARNRAGENGSAMFLYGDSQAVLYNSSVTDTGEGVALFEADIYSHLDAQFCLFDDTPDGLLRRRIGEEAEDFQVYQTVEALNGLTTGTLGNISGAPLFVNPLAHDYRLTTGSACIDAGGVSPHEYVWQVLVDRDGRQRPHGPQVDIGPFEFSAEVAPTPTPTPTPSPTPRPPDDWDDDGKPNDCETTSYTLLVAPGSRWTNALLPDSDGDGLLDGQEDPGGCPVTIPTLAMTNPRDRDTDGDGLWDGIEVLLLGTDPLDPNSPNPLNPDYFDNDGDGIPYLFDPDDNDPDMDGDGFLDGYELVHGFDPTDPLDFPPLGDVNGDGRTNNADAIMLMNFALGERPDLPRMENADVFIDGVVNYIDAMVLHNWTLGLVPTIPMWPVIVD